MTVNEWFFFKYQAARTLGRMMRWLTNWRDVWSSYRVNLPPPPLRFRSGLTLHHGPHDSPVSLLREVFGERHYRRHVECPSEGVLIDLGANIGAVTLDLASRSRRLRVHAYEPNPSAHRVLRRNVEANGLTDRVTVHDEAVGRGSGELRLWTNVNSMTATSHHDSPPTPEAVATLVPLVDLNEVVRRIGGEAVALLKIDTEGGEADTLEGATPATLGALRQVVLEYHDTLCPNASGRCLKVLEEAGFRCVVRPLNANHGLIYARRPRGRQSGVDEKTSGRD
ncbi:MAG: FkbM family methyltransferase [Acidobacteria bacterium]|nr:FkbM family methyltransferase [Acidobacteriota bacterium]